MWAPARSDKGNRQGTISPGGHKANIFPEMKVPIDNVRDRGDRRQQAHWGELLRPAEVLLYLLIAVAVVELYTRASYLVTHLFSVLMLFVFGGIIALLLTPVVDGMETVAVFRKRRGLAAIALLLVVLAVIAAIVALVTPSLVTQARALPALVAKGQALLADLQSQLDSHGIPFQVQLPTGTTSNGAVIGSALGILGGTLTTVIDILLVTVISIYFLAQGRELIAAARKLFPGHHEVFDFIMLAIGTTMAGYARGQLIMSVGMGLYTGIGMSLVGVHYAIVLGILTFFLEFIPLVGAPLGMAIAVVVALFQSPLIALLAAVVGVGGHALEAYIVDRASAGTPPGCTPRRDGSPADRCRARRCPRRAVCGPRRGHRERLPRRDLSSRSGPGRAHHQRGRRGPPGGSPTAR